MSSAIDSGLLAGLSRVEVEDSGAVLAHFELSEDFVGFKGHFPDQPICPAVVQLRAAALALGRARGERCTLGHVRSAKFSSPLGPGEPFTVRVVPRKEGHDVLITSAERAVAKARLTFNCESMEAGEGDE